MTNFRTTNSNKSTKNIRDDNAFIKQIPAKIPHHESPTQTTRSQDSLILWIPANLENLLPVGPKNSNPDK